MDSLALTRVKVNLLGHHLSSLPLARGPIYLGLSIPLLSWLQPYPLCTRWMLRLRGGRPLLHIPEDQRTSRSDLPLPAYRGK